MIYDLMESDAVGINKVAEISFAEITTAMVEEEDDAEVTDAWLKKEDLDSFSSHFYFQNPRVLSEDNSSVCSDCASNVELCKCKKEKDV